MDALLHRYENGNFCTNKINLKLHFSSDMFHYRCSEVTVALTFIFPIPSSPPLLEKCMLCLGNASPKLFSTKTNYLYKDKAVETPFDGACPRKDLHLLSHTKLYRIADPATEQWHKYRIEWQGCNGELQGRPGRKKAATTVQKIQAAFGNFI